MHFYHNIFIFKAINYELQFPTIGTQHDVTLVLTRDLTTLLVEANITRLSNGSYALDLRNVYEVRRDVTRPLLMVIF